MRKKNKRVVILIIILVLLGAAGAGLFYIYTTNKEGWNKVTRTPLAYLEYMGSYMSFDSEGFVISSSSTPPEDLPLVMGLNFEYVVVNETLPIEDSELFELCIDISQSLSDTDLKINKIQMDENEEISLYIGDISVELGTSKNLEKKLDYLKKIWDSLKEYTSGNLDMKIYNEDGEYIFEPKN